MNDVKDTVDCIIEDFKDLTNAAALIVEGRDLNENGIATLVLAVKVAQLTDMLELHLRDIVAPPPSSLESTLPKEGMDF